MGNNTSSTKYTASEAIARGKADTITSGWVSIAFAIVFGLGGVGLLIGYAIPHTKDCQEDRDCDDDDTCNKDRGHCQKKGRIIGLLIGGLVCLVIAGLLGGLGAFHLKMAKDVSYDRGVGLRALNQDRIQEEEAPYLAAGAGASMVLDSLNKGNQ